MFVLKSTVFQDGGLIPRAHTCDGRDISPALSWAGGSVKAASFALIMDDPDAPAKVWVHWVVFDLPAGTAYLPEAIPPRATLDQGGTHGINDFGNLGYGGPCPPSGTHNYVFTLYALDIARVPVDGKFTGAQVREAIKGHVLAQASFSGSYTLNPALTKS